MASRTPLDAPAEAIGYEIGFKRPPVHTRFKPGQSGNPNGRPKGRLNIISIIEQALLAKVIVTEGGRRVAKSKLEVSITQVANKAASGDLKAVQMMLALLPLLDPVALGETISPDLIADRQLALKIAARLLARVPPKSGEEQDE